MKVFYPDGWIMPQTPDNPGFALDKPEFYELLIASPLRMKAPRPKPQGIRRESELPIHNKEFSNSMDEESYLDP